MDCSVSSSDEKPLEQESCAEEDLRIRWWDILIIVLLLPLIIPLYLLYFIPYGLLGMLYLPLSIVFTIVHGYREGRVSSLHFQKNLRQAGRFLSRKQASQRFGHEGGTLISCGGDTWWTPDDLRALSPYSPHSYKESLRLQYYYKCANSREGEDICFDWDLWCAKHYISRSSGKAYFLRSDYSEKTVKKLRRKYPNLQHVQVFNPAMYQEEFSDEEDPLDTAENQDLYWRRRDSSDMNLPAPWYLNRHLFTFLLFPVVIICGLLAIPIWLLLTALIIPLLPFYLIYSLLAEWIPEYQFKRRIKKNNRLLPFKQADEVIRTKGGTLIVEPTCSKSDKSERLWWTTDDISSVSPHPAPSESEVETLRNRTWYEEDTPGIPWKCWCWKHYICPATGKAMLVDHWYDKEFAADLLEENPDLQIVELVLHHPSVQKENRIEKQRG